MNPLSSTENFSICNLPSKECAKIASKKIDNAANLIGKQVWFANFPTIREMFLNYVTGRNTTTLSEFISKMSVMKRAFLLWRFFMLVEKNIVIERGEKKSNVVVRNWKRNHSGDKA